MPSPYATILAAAKQQGIAEESLLFGLAYFVSLHPKTRSEYQAVPVAKRPMAIRKFGEDLYTSFAAAENPANALEIALYMGRTFHPLLSVPQLDGAFIKKMLPLMHDLERKALSQPRKPEEATQSLYFVLTYLNGLLGKEKTAKALDYLETNFALTPLQS